MGANYPLGSAGYDTTFELNEFQEPRIRPEGETIKDALLFVLFSKPGQYPSLPMIGMDLQSQLYEFYDELNEEDMKNQIMEQCSLMGTYISNGEIQIKKIIYHDTPSLMIHIEVKESFPAGYKSDKVGGSDKYMIGITYDEMKNLVYSVNGG